MSQPALFRGIYPTLRQVKARTPLSPALLEQAEQVYIRAYASRCPHAPPCGLRSTCIRQLAQEMREKGMA
jgi:hypothetical protein